MCIVIDTCTFSSIFIRSSAAHNEYKAVLNWVVSGKGKLIYGGTLYKNELRKAGKYIKFFLELKRAGKTVEVEKSEVDSLQRRLVKLVNKKDFDDPHILAIIIISRCRLLCSSDHRSFKYIKNKQFYPKRIFPPKIYVSSRNSDLLNDKNIADICKPCSKGSKHLKQTFGVN